MAVKTPTPRATATDLASAAKRHSTCVLHSNQTSNVGCIDTYSLLVLRAVLREMPQLSTFETTGAREETIHLSQLWATTPFVRSMSRLLSPSLC